jgi:hypothetical protein
VKTRAVTIMPTDGVWWCHVCVAVVPNGVRHKHPKPEEVVPPPLEVVTGDEASGVAHVAAENRQAPCTCSEGIRAQAMHSDECPRFYDWYDSRPRRRRR